MLFIRRAFYRNAGSVKNVGINHCSSHITMSKQFLYCTDVVSTFKEMGGEGVTEHMTAHLVCAAPPFSKLLSPRLAGAFMQMMTPYFPGAGVGRKPFRGKHILPAPFFGCLRILSCEGRPKIDFSKALRQVLLVLRHDNFKMFFELLHISFGKDRHAVFLSFAVPDDNLLLGKINVLHPQPKALHESQAAAVKVAAMSALTPVN